MIRAHLKKTLSGAQGLIRLDLSVEISAQSILGIMGPSGAGKTSILKMLAGLLQPEEGYIKVGEAYWYAQSEQINLPPQKRSVGIVFQDYALFPNMSVLQNLKYALPAYQSPSIIREVLQLMDMEKLQEQKPAHLSGGQQQRIALARAIVRRPQLLLLDEPFAALDWQMREKLQDDLLRLQDRYPGNIVIVSHDSGEIAHMADHVIYLEQGRAIRNGSPSETLPTLDSSKIKGIVTEINEENSTFVIYSPKIRGLCKFALPSDLQLKKGMDVTVNMCQGQTQINGKNE